MPKSKTVNEPSANKVKPVKVKAKDLEESNYFMTKNGKIPFGRPTKYDPTWMPKKVREVMDKGGTIAMVCRDLDISRDTLFAWEKRQEPEFKHFSDALKQGRINSQAVYEKLALDNLDNPHFSFTGWYMQVRNRFGYSDQRKVPIKLDADSSYKDQGRAIMEAVANGELTHEEGVKMISIVSSVAKIEEISELKKIIEQLERK